MRERVRAGNPSGYYDGDHDTHGDHDHDENDNDDLDDDDHDGEQHL